MGLRHADVIVDLQAGDTGKGKVAHHLAASKEYDMVVRYNGGANAGHTVYHNGQKIVTHQVPIGVLHGIRSFIGLGCVVNIPKLVEEIRMLKSQGIYTDGLVYLDPRAHVVTDEHLREDAQDTSIGTTRQGIGPAYRDKYARKGQRVVDLELHRWGFIDLKVCSLYDAVFENRHEKRILCEGAQGWQIDIDWGDYPYVTSSHCTIGSACLNGIPPQKIRKVFGIMKAYETYSGFKQFNTFGDDEILEQIQIAGQEFGATTGRKRQVRWLNLDEVIRAARVNGVTDLIINKLDILETVGVFKLVYDGSIRTFDSTDTFKQFVETVLHQKLADHTIQWSSTPHGI
jgi:adenylosuccinate synthase